MAIFTNIQHPMTFTFGILGNLISFMVYLAPVPTFHRIIKKKSTEGFQSIPYVVALFSSMVWIYYATLKTDATLLVTINVLGCVIETLYITIYVAYAPKNIKIQTTKLVVSMNFVGFWVIALSTHYLADAPTRATILGWICLVISVSVFAAPLSIMKKVIRTKSVEFMPFGLSFFLVLSAIMWFFYGLLQRDIYVAIPNIIGFVLGIVQMVLYYVYKNYKKKGTELEEKLPTSISSTDTYTATKSAYSHGNKDTNSCDQIITLKTTRDENMDAQFNEPPMINVEQPNIDDVIKDVTKVDMIFNASVGCSATVEQCTAIEDHDQMKTIEVADQVYLVGISAA